MIEKIKNIGKYFSNTMYYIGMTAMTVIAIFLIYNTILNQKEDTNMYQSTFDLSKLPSGVVIGLFFVPGTETELVQIDTTLIRYDYFDIAILTESMNIHQIRVPFYVAKMFSVGQIIEFKPKKKKSGNYKLGKYIYI